MNCITSEMLAMVALIVAVMGFFIVIGIMAWRD